MDSDSNMGKIVIGIIALVLIVGGVFLFMGSDSEEETANETSTSQEEAVVEEQQNIVELAQATDDLSTLVAAVVAADLADVLADETQEYTVFAPTNAAFDALPDGTLNSLLEPENKDDLASILTYHVVPGEAFSTDLSDGMMLETVNGKKLEVRITDAGVTIGGASVVIPDVDASNGVVHVIDTVLLP